MGRFKSVNKNVEEEKKLKEERYKKEQEEYAAEKELYPYLLAHNEEEMIWQFIKHKKELNDPNSGFYKKDISELIELLDYNDGRGSLCIMNLLIAKGCDASLIEELKSAHFKEDIKFI